MIYGVDVSHYTGTVDWRAVAGDGIAFAMCKATEGTGYTDPTLGADVPGAQAVGLPIGAYHFLLPGDGAAQADYYHATVDKTCGWDGVAALVDVESTASGAHPTRDDLAALLGRFRELRPGVPVGMYTGRWYWAGILGDPPLAGLDVWTWESRYVLGSGHWRELAAPVQSAWFDAVRIGGLRPSVIQYSSSGNCPGIAGDCDVNAFRGTPDDIRSLFYGDDMPLTDADKAWMEDRIKFYAIRAAQVWIAGHGNRAYDAKDVNAQTVAEALPAQLAAVTTKLDDMYRLLARAETAPGQQDPAHLPQSLLGVSQAIADLAAAVRAPAPVDPGTVAAALAKLTATTTLGIAE